MNERQLVLIVGPTAVGKTNVAVELAKQYNCEIISCDSRQFYRELAIGTAKPMLQEMQGVTHHFIDSHSISENYSAGDFERDVIPLLNSLFRSNQKVIMTGGSGLFVKAITHGLDELPTIDPKIRMNLMQRLEREGVEKLAEELAFIDPDYVQKVDLQNKQRVVRALEVYEQTGRPFSNFHKNELAERNFDIIKIGLERPREELYARINERVSSMLTDGLIDEVKSVLTFRNHNALKTVGYKEVIEFLDGNISETTMKELIQRNTRRYAKRQLTWFKNQDEFAWFSPDELDAIKQFITSQ